MESTRRQDEKIPAPGVHCLGAYLYQPAPLFDRDELHALVPVQGDGGKIPGDGAGIDIKGEEHAAVLFCLLKILGAFHGRAPFRAFCDLNRLVG